MCDHSVHSAVPVEKLRVRESGSENPGLGILPAAKVGRLPQWVPAGRKCVHPGQTELKERSSCFDSSYMNSSYLCYFDTCVLCVYITTTIELLIVKVLLIRSARIWHWNWIFANVEELYQYKQYCEGDTVLWQHLGSPVAKDNRVLRYHRSVTKLFRASNCHHFSSLLLCHWPEYVYLLVICNIVFWKLCNNEKTRLFLAWLRWGETEGS